MKNLFKHVTMLVAAAAVSAVFADGKIAAEGAAPGVWTQDYDAALALAKEKDLPVMLNFTGSDWCGWCKLMDKSVFAQDEWKSWAASNIVLVQVNFPNDKSLVPEKYVKRNSKLAEEYEIEGYPTYVVLGSDGKTELGRLGADRNATPGQFIADAEELLVVWKGIDRYLTPEEYREFSETDAELSRITREVNDYFKNGTAALKAIHAKLKTAKTEEEKTAIHHEFAAKKSELEEGIQKIGAKGDELNEKRTKFVEKAVKAMREEKKGKAK